jgi:cellobiose phosphorylase
VETLLGLSLEKDKLHLAPCVPADWETYAVDYRYRDTIYHITVVQLGVSEVEPMVTVDGVAQDAPMISLVDDGAHHAVEVRLNRAPAAASRALTSLH